jgi:hypothetical protein
MRMAGALTPQQPVLPISSFMGRVYFSGHSEEYPEKGIITPSHRRFSRALLKRRGKSAEIAIFTLSGVQPGIGR